MGAAQTQAQVNPSSCPDHQSLDRALALGRLPLGRFLAGLGLRRIGLWFVRIRLGRSGRSLLLPRRGRRRHQLPHQHGRARPCPLICRLARPWRLLLARVEALALGIERVLLPWLLRQSKDWVDQLRIHDARLVRVHPRRVHHGVMLVVVHSIGPTAEQALIGSAMDPAVGHEGAEAGGRECAVLDRGLEAVRPLHGLWL
mmetsp:Transcript_54101/g.125842  ORF Transcript_54101/g.125842 Transcript_54101/m.125842 type:complete len:200 (-) Transcript_54101:1303-1902(-)